jgi:hypothetical protein
MACWGLKLAQGKDQWVLILPYIAFRICILVEGGERALQSGEIKELPGLPGGFKTKISGNSEIFVQCPHAFKGRFIYRESL